MARMLKIRNWDKWQTYRKDRGQPPWIKLHRSLLRDVNWVSLGCQQRGQLAAMWLLAADREGLIPADPALVRKLCFMDDDPDIKLFIEKGFLDGDASMTPERRQHDVAESDAETKAEEEYRSNDFDRFWKVYPKKVKKKPAQEIWKRKKINGQADSIIEDVKNRVTNDQRWLDGFIPDPTTYLTQERWEDEVSQSGKPAQQFAGAI